MRVTAGKFKQGHKSYYYTNEIGNRYGKLLVIKGTENDRFGHARWLCQCDCGEKVVRGASYLRKKKFSSCGCNRTPLKSNESQKDRRKRDFGLQRQYGITLEEYEVCWVAQQGRCHICKLQMTEPRPQKGQASTTVVVDHDHETGKMRALLCKKCNTGLGFFNDNVDLLQKAIKYLEISSYG